MSAPNAKNPLPFSHLGSAPGLTNDDAQDSRDINKGSAPPKDSAANSFRFSWAAIRNILEAISTLLLLVYLLIGSLIIVVASCFGLLPGQIPSLPVESTGDETYKADKANNGAEAVMTQKLRTWKAQLTRWMAFQLYTPSPSDNADADADGVSFPWPSWAMRPYMIVVAKVAWAVQAMWAVIVQAFWGARGYVFSAGCLRDVRLVVAAVGLCYLLNNRMAPGQPYLVMETVTHTVTEALPVTSVEVPLPDL